MTDRQFLSLWYFVGGMSAFYLIQYLLSRFWVGQPIWMYIMGGLAFWWLWGRVYSFFFRRV